MEIIFGVNNFKRYKNPVVVLGVFDGVHLGHKLILKSAAKKAKALGVKSIVLTMWPHPKGRESIHSLAHRLKLISQTGIDAAFVINFTPSFSALSGEDFVKKILAGKIGASHVYVGRNFRFGRGASADTRVLSGLSGIYNFKLKTFRVLKKNGTAISSTYIRRLIKKGDLALSSKLLGRPVSILGTVIRGDFIARYLGFPTANINPHHEVIPAKGIYAIEVIFEKKNYRGICYIGSKPTFKTHNSLRITHNAQRTTHIEVHVFDFNKNIYGKDLEVLFIKKLRSEQKFDSPAKLTLQIKKDILKAKSVFPRHS
ncbi:MAG: riboflavin biosynthesis protein RibF [Candidatus Omnitrophota bacterium]